MKDFSINPMDPSRAAPRPEQPVEGCEQPAVDQVEQEKETWAMPTLIKEAQQAFHGELPQLLQEHAGGEWVAYRGSQRLGIGRTKTELYRDCLRRGLERGEFLVRQIDRGNLYETDIVDVSPSL
jgi:hypothetical protein